MEQEVISVVVPVYNIEKYLPKCLESIANQTYKKLEIILVDDGSTDSSGWICDKYAAGDSRARVIHQPNQGLWAARNSGQDAATGEYLFFPDGDDYFHYDMLRQMHHAITRGSGYDMAVVGRKIVQSLDEDCTHLIDPEWKEVSSDKLFKDIFIDYPFPNVWNKLYRVDSVKDLRARPYSIAQDLDFNIRVFLHINKAICTGAVFYYWLWHDGQITKRANYYKIQPVIYYRNYKALSPGKRYLGYILLVQLYKKMSVLKAFSLKDGDKLAIFGSCKEFYQNTINDYIKERQIPLTVKLRSLLAYHFPHLYASFLKFLDYKAGNKRGKNSVL